MDEPESIGALGVAGREHLDNLIFVVNCNLQRLDGPVRGNGKIIQELEAVFRGAGWNVIKVIWGSRWDALLAKDVDGVLLDRMNTTLDGEYQKLAVESGAYIREHFFGPDPRLRKMVEDLSDDELVSLPRGGHDYRKLYAAYKLATEQRGAPTVILAKTIKGWTLGPEIEARNATHQIKKMTKAQLRTLRDRLYLTDDIPDAALEGDPPYIRPAEGSDAMEYLRARGRVLAGPLPVAGRPARAGAAARRQGVRGVRRGVGDAVGVDDHGVRPPAAQPGARPDRRARWWRRSSPTRPGPSGSSRSSPRPRSTRPTASTTCRSTPTCPSTTPRARRARSSRRASPRRGRWPRSSRWPRPTRPGGSRCCPSTSSIPCSASSASATWPGRSATCAGGASWPAARRGARRCMGEGLQHDDGQSPLLASTNPAAMVYDASFAYEVAVIMEAAVTEMLGPDPKDRFWYLTLYNETYPMPALPEGDEGAAVRRGIIDGIYRFAAGARDRRDELRASLCFSGPMWSVAVEAQRDAGRALRRGRRRLGRDVVDQPAHRRARGGALEPAASRGRAAHGPSSRRHSGTGPTPSWPSPTTCARCPTRCRASCERPYTSLGTDGFGRSDARDALRSYFEVDAAHLVVAVLQQLALGGRVDPLDRVRRPSPTSASTPTGPPRSPSEVSRRREQRHERGQCLLGTGGHGEHQRAPIGLDVDGDVEEGAALLLALAERRPPRRARPRVVRAPGAPRSAPASTEATDDATRARHSSTRVRQPIGVEACRRSGPCAPVGRHRRCRQPAGVAGDLHLAEVLEQLLEDVQQHGALGLGVGHGVVGVAAHAAGRRRGVEPDDVLAQTAPARCSVRRSSPATSPVGGELGRPVAPDGPLGHRRAAPVLHDAEAVGQDGEGRVGVAERRAPVGQVVAELLDDRRHLVEGQVDEPQVVGRPRRRPAPAPSALSGRPRHRGRSPASGRAGAACPMITSVRVTFSSTERRLARTATQTCWRCSAAPS